MSAAVAARAAAPAARLPPPAKDRGPGGLALLEEAVHLLRRAPLAVHLAWLLGAAPFTAGLLYFLNTMRWHAFAAELLPPYALGLALLFVWLKVWQAEAAGRLRAFRAGRAPAPLTPARGWRIALSQAAVQPIGLFLLPASFVAAIPFAWVFAFFQSHCVLDEGAAAGEPGAAPGKRALRQMGLRSGENHVALLTLVPLALFAWLNLFVAMAILPELLKMLLGLETPFTQATGWAAMKMVFNSTFFSVSVALTWLALDPLIKACYVLRCFYGESLASGEDLRADLRALREQAA